MVLPISIFTMKRRSEGQAARHELLLAQELSRQLKEGNQDEIIKLIPLVQSVLQESLGDIFDGRKIHVVGINTDKGTLRIKEKDPDIYTETRPSLLNRHPDPAKDYILSISEGENNIFQALIDRANMRIDKYGELIDSDVEGNFPVIGREQVEHAILSLRENGRKIENREFLAYVDTEYDLGLTPMTAKAPEGAYTPPEERG